MAGLKELFNSLGVQGKDSLGTLVSATGNLIGGAVSNGYDSGIGSAISGISSLIPNPLISAAAGVLGGVADKVFGAKLNEENIAKVENTIDEMKGFQSNASSFDELSNNWANANFGFDFNNDYIGKEGAFSHSVTDKADKLRDEMSQAKDYVANTLNNNLNNLTKNQMQNLLANYSAYGGPLNMYKSGGKIYIKPKNRGKFTALKERTGKSASWFKAHGTPSQKKMATFALNARKWKHADGGPMYTQGGVWNNGLTYINEGGSHESNPFEGVPISINSEGVPNLVEEGEVIFDDYVFSDRLKASKDLLKLVNLPKSYGNKSFSDIAKSLSKESEERPNDPISKKGLLSSMVKLQQAQEIKRQGMNKKGNKYDSGGDTESSGKDKYMSYLRFAPVIGSAIGLGQTLFNDPDYSSVQTLTDAANLAGTYTPVQYSPIGNYLQYKPFDRDYYANKLTSQANATRNAILNNSGGNRAAAMAAMLSADYNNQGRFGDLYRQAEEYNLAQRQAVESFNRQTNMANTQGALQAAMANQKSRQSALATRLSGINTAEGIRAEIDRERGKALSANTSNFFNSIGNVGIDTMNRLGRDMLIRSSAFGTLSEKPLEWSDEQWKVYKESLSEDEQPKAKGGYLTIKKKKGGRYA